MVENGRYILNKNIYEIVEEHRGIRTKFWMRHKGFLKYLFKANRENTGSREDIGEVLIYQIAQKIDMDCAKYYFAGIYEGEKLNMGVLTENFKTKSNVQEISGHTLLKIAKLHAYDNQFGKSVKMKNTLKAYFEAIDCVRKDCFINSGKLEIDPMVEVNLMKQAVMDYLTMQADRHWGNVTFLLERNVKTGNNVLKLAPMFDSGNCFGFHLSNKRINGAYISQANFLKKHPSLPEDSVDFESLGIRNQLPILGIKTPTAYIKSNQSNLAVLSPIKDVSKKLDNTFLQELAEMIEKNPLLIKFLKNIEEKVDIDEICNEINGKTVDEDKKLIPIEYQKIAKTTFNYRLIKLKKMIKENMNLKDKDSAEVKNATSKKEGDCFSKA